MIKVKDEKGLERDPNSKAILQTDLKQLLEHRRRKSILRKMHEDSSKVSSLEEQLNKQNEEIEQLKQLVNKLLAQNK